ncbi:MAG: hypothetical protein AB4426_35095, partial [Xenococcaceae cyanobacterium]
MEEQTGPEDSPLIVDKRSEAISHSLLSASKTQSQAITQKINSQEGSPSRRLTIKAAATGSHRHTVSRAESYWSMQAEK